MIGPDLKPGVRFGHYLIGRPLGRGGMAQVWAATDTRAPNGSAVAIKAILPELLDQAEVHQLFEEEARVGLLLHHPNVARVIDVGPGFIVTELVVGHTVAELLAMAQARGCLFPLSITSRVVLDAAAGLGAAHGHTDDDGRPAPILHRDVSPQNLMLGVDGVVKVLDFGIARAADRSFRTTTGLTRGKVRYMSPEQVQGRPLAPSSDLFSLGLVLWELLTGTKVFDAPSDVSVIAQILSFLPVPPSRLRRELSSGVDELVLSMLEREPSSRLGTTEALKSRLAIEMPPASWPEVAAWAAGFSVRRGPLPAIAEPTLPGSLAPAPIALEPTEAFASSDPTHIIPSRAAVARPPPRSRSLAMPRIFAFLAALAAPAWWLVSHLEAPEAAQQPVELQPVRIEEEETLPSPPELTPVASTTATGTDGTLARAEPAPQGPDARSPGATRVSRPTRAMRPAGQTTPEPEPSVVAAPVVPSDHGAGTREVSKQLAVSFQPCKSPHAAGQSTVRLLLDGAAAGASPRTLRLDLGRHTLEARAVGCRTQRVELVVSELGAPQLVGTLSDAGIAWLSIGKPRGSVETTIIVDGERVGPAPRRIPLSAGPHLVRLDGVGHRDDFSVDLAAGEDRLLPLKIP